MCLLTIGITTCCVKNKESSVEKFVACINSLFMVDVEQYVLDIINNDVKFVNSRYAYFSFLNERYMTELWKLDLLNYTEFIFTIDQDPNNNNDEVKKSLIHWIKELDKVFVDKGFKNKIRVFTTKHNYRVGACRNKIFEEANGEYVTTLDGDDTYYLSINNLRESLLSYKERNLDVIKKQYKYKNRITFPHVSTTNYIYNKNFLKKYNFNYPVKTGFEDLILTIVLDYIKNHNDVKIGFAKNMIVYYYVSSRTQDDFNRENRVIDIDEIYKLESVAKSIEDCYSKINYILEYLESKYDNLLELFVNDYQFGLFVNNVSFNGSVNLIRYWLNKNIERIVDKQLKSRDSSQLNSSLDSVTKFVLVMNKFSNDLDDNYLPINILEFEDQLLCLNLMMYYIELPTMIDLIKTISRVLNIDYAYLFNKFRNYSFDDSDKNVIINMYKILNKNKTITNFVYRFASLLVILFDKYDNIIYKTDTINYMLKTYFNFILKNFNVYEFLRYFEVADSSENYSTGICVTNMEPIEIKLSDVQTFVYWNKENKGTVNNDEYIIEKYNITYNDIKVDNFNGEDVYDLISDIVNNYIDYNKFRNLLQFIPHIEQYISKALLLTNQISDVNEFNPLINTLIMFVLSSSNVKIDEQQLKNEKYNFTPLTFNEIKLCQ